ncbi:HAD-IIIA family hydrolase [Schlesneria paludicola]|uniref:HAD-IIIA family hydrolase n=1 Tax=Schlesneria paludicola TaxID=360056 RepID=UPI000299F4E9|nr:HAD-IIIA family hydrolase [Schlesneria paludicola]
MTADHQGPLLSTEYQWMVFDAVGTLIRPNPSVAVAYHSIAVRHGSRQSVDEIGQRFRQSFRQTETETFPGGPDATSIWQSSDAIEMARWRWIVEQVIPDVPSIDECFTEMWDHFARPSSWACFDDVGSTLQALSNAGYRLAIASNFDSRLHTVCSGHPELKLIEQRFVSSETGYRKPAPEFYAQVISRCGCDANQIFMIGDDLQHDVSAPRANGMNAVLIDRLNAGTTGNTIRSLHQLLKH